MKIRITQITMNKEKADELLRGNTINRPLTLSLVEKYGQLMRKGEWRLNGESIIVSDTGKLLQGQHRLEAVSKYDVEVEMLLTEGVEESSFATLDTGRSRTGADVVAISGYSDSDSKVLATMIRLDILFNDKGSIKASSKQSAITTPSAILARLEKHKDRYLYALKFIKKFPKKSMLIPVASAAFLFLRMSKINKEFTESWMEGFLLGANLKQEDPRLWIRDLLWREHAQAKKRTQQNKMGIIIKAWNLALSGREIKHPHNLWQNAEDAFKYIAR